MCTLRVWPAVMNEKAKLGRGRGLGDGVLRRGNRVARRSRRIGRPSHLPRRTNFQQTRSKANCAAPNQQKMSVTKRDPTLIQSGMRLFMEASSSLASAMADSTSTACVCSVSRCASRTPIRSPGPLVDLLGERAHDGERLGDLMQGSQQSFCHEKGAHS